MQCYLKIPLPPRPSSVFQHSSYLSGPQVPNYATWEIVLLYTTWVVSRNLNLLSGSVSWRGIHYAIWGEDTLYCFRGGTTSQGGHTVILYARCIVLFPVSPWRFFKGFKEARYCHSVQFHLCRHFVFVDMLRPRVFLGLKRPGPAQSMQAGPGNAGQPRLYAGRPRLRPGYSDLAQAMQALPSCSANQDYYIKRTISGRKKLSRLKSGLTITVLSPQLNFLLVLSPTSFPDNIMNIHTLY